MVTALGKPKRKRTTKKRTAKRAAPKRRRATRKKTTRRRKSAAPTRRRKKLTKAQRRRIAIRNLKKGCKKVRTMKANRKGSYKANRKRRAAPKRRRSYKANARRRSAPKRRRRRSYKKNVAGAQFKQELMKALKLGAIVTGGYLAHRGLTNLVDKHVLSKVEAFQTGKLAEYRSLISGVLVAAVGIPAAVRVLPKHAGVAAAGMAASLIVGGVKRVLQQTDQVELLEAFSDYTNAPGFPQYSGMGSYYEFQPHQIYGMNGFGEFYETAPIPGVSQAAAGFGQPMVQGQMLTQAAAGYGQLQQMYANGGGVGEYYAYGVEGVGEYYDAPGPMSGFGSSTYEGIHPNLNSAENALDVAEAAAGVGAFGTTGQMLTQAAAGLGNLPLQSTVDPTIRAMNIPDHPGGSRAGILQGGDGIFGG